ncbi:MAG: hypothetical protein ACRELY_31615, partial [Polyangiaceae bacterium]
PSLSSTEMLSQLERSTTFASALARLQKLEKRVSDEQFVAQGDAWTMGLQFYALLQRRALTDGTLAASLGPITSFFNYRHDSTKPTKLQTRANAKLRDAQRLVARAKPRAAVLEEEYDDAHTATPAAPAVSVVTPAPAPVVQPASPVVQPAPVAPAPSIIQPAPAPSVTITPAASSSASNGVSNGASNGAINGSNGYVNGASNGASSV